MCRWFEPGRGSEKVITRVMAFFVCTVTKISSGRHIYDGFLYYCIFMKEKPILKEGILKEGIIMKKTALALSLCIALALPSIALPGGVASAVGKTSKKEVLRIAAGDPVSGGAASGSAADGEEEDEFSYEIDDSYEGAEGAVIKSYNGEATTVSVPDTIDGYPVTVIGYGAFMDTKVKKVTLPDTVKVIDSNAFSGCTGLKSITLPDGLQMLEGSVFADCKALKSIVIPASVTELGYSAFSNCAKLEEIRFEGNRIREIDEDTFYGCKKLESISLPSSVKEIGERAFYRCSKLESVKLNGKLTTIKDGVFENCFALRAIRIPASVKKLGERAFRHCNGLKTIEFKGKSTVFGKRTFDGCRSLRKIHISHKMKNVPEFAFYGCSALRKVVLSKNTRIIKKNAFRGCTGLKKLNLTSKIYGIGDGAFEKSGLTSIHLPGNLQYIGNSAFSETDLKSVRLPGRVTYIGNHVFSGCTKLKNIAIPASVRGVNPGAFGNCTSLKAINVASGNKSYSSTSGVLFDKQKTKLLQYPIAKSGKSYTVPNSVSVIRSHAFENNKYLESVTVGAEKIHNFAFSEMPRLKNVTLQNGVTNIAEHAFGGNRRLQSVQMADSVKVISAGAFSDSRITRFRIPSHITSFSDSALEGCRKLTAYEGSSSGKYPVIDGILYEKGGKVLREYPAHKAGSTFTVPTRVERVRTGAFSHVNNLKKLFFENTIKNLDSDSVYHCKRLKQIVFAEGTKLKTGYYAVENCYRLAVIVGPKQSVLESMARAANATLITL